MSSSNENEASEQPGSFKEEDQLRHEQSNDSDQISSAPLPSGGESKEYHEEEGGQAPAIDNPSRVSWESGSASVTAPSRVTVKLLVSNNMAGSIIGRSGQTVNDLQNKSSAKIRLSQSGDYFPGTSDRVCLIHGSLDNSRKGVALVLGKLYELQLELVETQVGDQVSDDPKVEEDEAEAAKINFTARILVPSAACGMLIGSEGGTIKRLKESAGASSVRLSPKVMDHSLPRTFERVLTVSASELDACVSFTGFILEGFVRHPEICRYLNATTSYSRNSNAAYAMPRSPPAPAMPRSPPAMGGFSGAPSPVQNIPRQAYSHAVHEVDAGMQGLGFDAQPNVQAPRNQRQPAYIHPPPVQPQTAPQASNISSTINLAIPDSMIGAILGRRGQTLTELQSTSGARIRVSQRDEFVPGTSNRIVTLSGSQENIDTARNMIRQLLSRNP